MKISAVILFLLIPVITVAQNYKGMNRGDMQNAMQQMQKMQSCMQNIDQAALSEIEQRSRQFESDVKSLCARGKRGEAQEKAVSFGREMADDPTMQAMRKCGEMVKGMMPKMPYTDPDKDRTHQHVCDQYAE